MIFGIFIDSWLFIFSSTVLQSSFGLNSGIGACDAGILLCLVCYLSSKVLSPLRARTILELRLLMMADRLYVLNTRHALD